MRRISRTAPAAFGRLFCCLVLFEFATGCHAQVTMGSGVTWNGGVTVGGTHPAATYPNLQTRGSGGWTVQYGNSCCGGSNSGTGAGAWGIASPSLSGGSMSLTNVYTGSAGSGLNAQMFTTLDCSILAGGSCLSANNITAEVHYYIPSSSASPQALEGPNVVLYDGTHQEYPSLQCNSVGLHWWVWNSGGATWVDTGNSCSAALTKNTWHDLVANYAVDGVAHTLGYVSATLDGSSIGTLGQSYPGETYASATALKAQVQLDGNEAGASTTAVNYDEYNVTVTTNPTTATPTASPAAGAYSSAQSVTLSSSTGGATICYTTDGSSPAAATPGTCSNGTTYSAPFTVSVTTTVKALGTKASWANSSILTSVYTISGGGSGGTPVLLTSIGRVGNAALSVPEGGATITGTALPQQLNFYAQGTNTSSMPLAISISNCYNPQYAATFGVCGTTAAAFTVTGMAITGANSSDFALTGTCGSIASGSDCEPTITFTPTAAAGTAETATLTVTYSGATVASQTLPLTGASATVTTLSSSACPTTLAPSTNYQLTADIACGGTVFVVSGTDTFLNLNGHTITYGNTSSADLINAIQSQNWSTYITVYNGTVSSGSGTNTYGEGEPESSVIGYTGSYEFGATLAHLTINAGIPYSHALELNGGVADVHDDILNMNWVGTCNNIGCRAEQQGSSIYQANAGGTPGPMLIYDNAQNGGAQGGFVPESPTVIAYNSINPGNASGTNTNGFGIVGYCSNCAFEYNSIMTPLTAGSSSRGILISGADGLGANVTVAHNLIVGYDNGTNPEYGGCQGGGAYGLQVDDNPAGPTLSENNAVVAYAKGCMGSALRLTDSNSDTLVENGDAYTALHLSGFTACTFQVDTDASGGCAVGTSIDGPTANVVENATFSADDADVLFDVTGGSGVVFESPTFQKAATAASGFHTFVAVTGTPSQGGGSVTDVHFIDPTYETGTGPTDLDVPAQDPTTPNMGAVTFFPADWTQSMTVTGGSSGNPISGALVTFTDAASTAYTCTTDVTGKCNAVVSQYKAGNMTGANQALSLNPYGLVVSKSGCTNYTASGLTITATASRGVSLAGC